MEQLNELKNTYVDDLVSVLIPQFEALAPKKKRIRKNGKGFNLKGWKALAQETCNSLVTNYPDDRPPGEQEYATCWAQIGKLKSALDKAALDAKDHANISGIRTINKLFIDDLYQFFGVYRANTTARYKEEVLIRSRPENRIEIDMGEYLHKAHSVLSAIGSDLKPNWYDVSCALALTTGRRMSEIHMSAHFEPIDGDDHAVMFSGQLKGKGRRAEYRSGVLIDGRGKPVKDVAFEIPVLVPSSLVIQGLQFLDDEGMRVPDGMDTVKVNSRYSKRLSQTSKERWGFLGEETTYHKFRAAYFLLCLQMKKLDLMDAPDFITRILGDTSRDSQNAYKRFKIKSNSLTHI